jgi:hypothetical protein
MIKQINENTMNLDTFYNHVRSLGSSGAGNSQMPQMANSSNKCKY